MGRLIVPRGPNFGVMQNNLGATPGASTPGSAVTSNASANQKGIWAQLIASANYDVFGISLMICNTFTGGAANHFLVDIGVGANPNETVIVPDILCGAMGAGTGGLYPMFLPIFIPKGTRISARCQDGAGSDVANVTVFLHGGGPTNPPWRCFSRAESIGTTSSGASSGLAHTAGNSGAESTWTNIGSTTAHTLEAIMPMVQSDTVTVVNALAYHLELGIASTTLCEYFFCTATTESIVCMFPAIPHYCHVPVGTQLMIRAECSGTAQAFQYGILGFY